jgi:hypothetical protein
MLMRPVSTPEPVAMGGGLRLALAITAIATVGIGLFPDFFIRAVTWSMSSPQLGSVADVIGR